MKRPYFWITAAFLLLGLMQCRPAPEKLPYIGEPETVSRVVDGKTVTETVYPTIPPFAFINQAGKPITQRDFAGKIYVADFFFVTCPTICPVMKKNLLDVYRAYRHTSDVRILSHTIDPDHDTPAVLNQYAKELGVTGSTWQFVTGDREKIYELGERHYLVTAGQNASAPGGFIHSGHFILIDKERHIRGLYDGTTEKGTRQLMADITTLRKEYND